MYKRLIENKIKTYLKSKDHKIFFVWGPRRSGKTTLIKRLAAELKVGYYNFDFISDREKFTADRDILTNLVKTNPIILIDEVQNYPEGTIPLKLLVDEFKVKIIATGSSELRQKTGQDFDSLASRFSDHYCLPFSVSEIVANHKIKPDEKVTFERKLATDFQVYGAYPEVYTTSSKDQKIV
ncbi:MAG: AAA family ATPase, partial [Patescibacteria group bacterium]